MNRIKVLGLSLLLGLTANPESGQAAVLFFVNDPAGFAAARAGAGMVLLGTENFETNTIPAGTITTVNGPLVSGVANGVFPAGLNPALGLTVQPNDLGANPAVPSLGTGFLAAASAGFLSSPSTQVSNNREADSTDLIFQPGGGLPTAAVGFVPLYFDSAAGSSISHSGTIQVRVFNAENVLVDSVSIPAVQFDGNDFLGIVATGTDTIGRVNLWDGSTAQHWQGADNIAVYVPEPGAALVLLGSLLGFVRRRK